MRRRRAWLAAALLIASASPAWALQRNVRATAKNFSEAPVRLRDSSVELVEAYTPPSLTGIPESGKSRVRYANRAGLVPPTYLLKGGLVCQNAGAQQVEAVKLTIVILDAFHEPVPVGADRRTQNVQQLVALIPRNSSKRLEWEMAVATGDVYEVAVVVTGVRFSDGSVWVAPVEELIDEAS